MEKYEGFDLEIVTFEERDIICTSINSVYSQNETVLLPVGREGA